jgi:DNA gyrase/topoisomerase IV subunit B
MSKDQSYTASDIEDLNDRDHVRLRTQIYLGNMHPTVFQIPILTEHQLVVREVEFIPSVYKAVGEILDNSLDELSQITSKNKVLKIVADSEKGTYQITDNGRGIPIEQKTDRQGKMVWVPELALSRLRSGRNFSDEKESGVIGQNGVGAACTNFCSSKFGVTVQRNKTKYEQGFIDGVAKISRPKITNVTSAQTYTQVSFQLDSTVFQAVSLPEELMRNRAIEIAMTNPDVTVDYNGTKFQFKKGLSDLVGAISNGHPYYEFTIEHENVIGQFFVMFGIHDDPEEQMFTWVNSSLLFDGGKCNTQFLNAFMTRLMTHLEPQSKKLKIEISRNDIKHGLLVMANLKVKNPEYDSQSKTRLTGPDLRLNLVSMVEDHWKFFVKKSDGWISEVLARAESRYNRVTNKAAIDEHEKNRKKQIKLIDGLLDATSKNRSECKLLITEGDSAKSQICEARDPKTIAAFALRGKINNVRGSSPAQVLKMDKIKNLLTVIGLTPGKRAIRSDLNYGQIIISTDADYDGDDIFTLLVNLFYQFWPELFDPSYTPIIYRLVAPNVCLVKGTQRIHFTTRGEYEKVKTKYKGFDVRYYKGLGSMGKADWDMILSGKTKADIPITDDGCLDGVLELLFGNDAQARKVWLTEKE